PYVITTSGSFSTGTERFILGTATWIIDASQNSFAIFISENIDVGSPRSYLFWCGKIINVETNEIGVAQVGGGFRIGDYPSLVRWKSLDEFGNRHQYKTPSIDRFRYADLLYG